MSGTSDHSTTEPVFSARELAKSDADLLKACRGGDESAWNDLVERYQRLIFAIPRRAADVTVFRPSDGGWYWLNSSNGQFSALHFGLDGDVPVAGNYDGDGKTDIAVYRPSDGMWYINRSSDGGFEAIRFGISEDIPVIAK